MTESGCLILQAEPGAGKTSLVPLALLDIVPKEQSILLLQPRRLAAKSAAHRMASLLNQKVGETIGYRIRGETKVSPSTRILVMTEAILVRLLQADADLPGTGLVIFDEFHERSLDADLGLALCLESRDVLREDLRLLVMSATLDTGRLQSMLRGSKIIESEGRSFPVSINYFPPAKHTDWSTQIVPALKQFLASEHNRQNATDVLIFLPGVAEIRRIKKQLEDIDWDGQKFQPMELYGDLDWKLQQRVLNADPGSRRIVLSTNIAETSITIENIGCVIDSGLERQSSFDPNVGFNRLQTRKISQASAIQRSGRAGRLQAGVCYRLWSPSENLRSHSLPEILRADLAGFSLELVKWGITDCSELRLLDQPNVGSFQQAIKLLQSLNAINDSLKLTDVGKILLGLGIHPRIGRMLISAQQLGVSDLACLLAAMLEEPDILRSVNPVDSGGQGRILRDSNFLSRLDYLLDVRKTEKVPVKVNRILEQANRLKKRLEPNVKNKIQLSLSESRSWTAILLAHAFFDRIAQPRGNGYRLANGSGAQTYEQEWDKSQWLVVVELGGQVAPPRIFQALAIECSELEEHFNHLIKEAHVIRWDEATQAVKATIESQLGALILRQRTWKGPPKEAVKTELIKAVTYDKFLKLPWSKGLTQWRGRITMIRQLPEYEKVFPDIDSQVLHSNRAEWLGPFLDGLSRLDQITPELLENALKTLVSWEDSQLLERLMPTKIRLASGSTIALDYTARDKPLLSVKLQEMFGENEGPRVAGGKISVLVQLLSPAQRPLHLTEDLASFWATSYNEVKKEGRGRYPKHPWPDDPLTAKPTRFTKRHINSD